MFHIAVPLNKWVYGHRVFEVIPCSTDLYPNLCGLICTRCFVLGQPLDALATKTGVGFHLPISITATAPPSVSIFPMWVWVGNMLYPIFVRKKGGFKNCFSWVKFPLTPQPDELNPQFHPYFTHFSRFLGATFFGRALQPGDPRCHCHFLHRRVNRWFWWTAVPSWRSSKICFPARGSPWVTIFLGKRPNN